MSWYYYFIPAFFILLFIFPLVAEVRVTFNLHNLTGVFCVFVYGIKVQYYFFEIKGKSIVLKNQKQTKTQELSFDSDTILLYKNFGNEIKDKVRLKEGFVNYNIGFGDAFLSSMIAGMINSLLLMFFASIKNRKPTASLGVYDTVSYNREIFEVALRGKVSITLIDVVYSFIVSVILTSRMKKRNSMQKQNVV